MAKKSNILDIIQGLANAAAKGYAGHDKQTGEDTGLQLRRDEELTIHERQLQDAFKVRFAADKMIVTYQSEVHLSEVNPRNKFEDEIEARFNDITKFLKKEYRKARKESVSLTPAGDANIMVQNTSRYRSWVEAQKQYNIGDIGPAESIKQPSEDKLDSNIKKFMDLVGKKRPSNDKAKKHPDTPEA
jgi:hypothetical protein